MNTDRSIHLDLSLPHLGAGGQDGLPGGNPRESSADPQAQERFRQALASPAPEAEAPVPAVAPGPLQGLVGASCLQADDVAERRALARRLGEMVIRLMVGQGRSGGARVQMDLGDDVLPGVSVAIERIEGRLNVEFTCCNDDSRRRLAAAMGEMCDELSQRLRTMVLVAVQTDDEEDRCRQERISGEGGAAPGMVQGGPASGV